MLDSALMELVVLSGSMTKEMVEEMVKKEMLETMALEKEEMVKTL